MAKTGRPLAEISRREFEGLCSIQCTEKEICAVLGVTDKTLTKWCKRTYHKSFSEIFREKRKIGHASLRRTQWQMAKTNVSMAIFLGKNYLGQSDKVAVDQTEVLNKLDSMLDGIKEDADGHVREKK